MVLKGANKLHDLILRVLKFYMKLNVSAKTISNVSVARKNLKIIYLCH